MSNEIYIQVGVTALRSPKGDFLPSVPIYIKADQLKNSGLTQAEENVLHDISGFFAEKHQEIKAQKKDKQKQEGKKCQNTKI